MSTAELRKPVGRPACHRRIAKAKDFYTIRFVLSLGRFEMK